MAGKPDIAAKQAATPIQETLAERGVGAPPPVQRPKLRDARREVAEHLDTRGTRQAGSVCNKQLDTDSAKNPDGTTPHFEYYYFDRGQLDPGRVRALREKLITNQYWPADGDEYVPECANAEIWMTYADIGRDRLADRVKHHAKQKLIFDSEYRAALEEKARKSRYAQLLGSV